MTDKYAKLINGVLYFAPENKDNIINYNLDTDRMIADGYKIFVEALRPETNRKYHIEYVEESDYIIEAIIYDCL